MSCQGTPSGKKHIQHQTHSISHCLTHLATVPGLTTGPLLNVTALCAGAPGNPQLP